MCIFPPLLATRDHNSHKTTIYKRYTQAAAAIHVYLSCFALIKYTQSARRLVGAYDDDAAKTTFQGRVHIGAPTASLRNCSTNRRAS